MIDQTSLKEILSRVDLEIDLDSLDYHKSFSDQGLDSLDVFYIFSEVENSLNISFSDEDFGNIKNFSDLLKFLNL